MSTLKVTNIAGLTGSSTNVIEGLAKTWGNLNGTGTIALRDSYNVSSTTDNGTGQYRFSYSNSMSNGNYGFSFGGSYTGTFSWGAVNSSAAPATSYIDYVQGDRNGSNQDATYACIEINGDLA